MINVSSTYSSTIALIVSVRNDQSEREREQTSFSSNVATADATQLLTDLQSFQYRPMKSFSTDRDELMKSLVESLTMIFTRSHLDGIRTVLQTIDSPISQSLSEYLQRIDQSLRMKLNEHEHLILESLIIDHLNGLVGFLCHTTEDQRETLFYQLE